MRKVTSAAAWLGLCAAMLIVGAPAPCAEAPKPAEPATLEKQIEYLQDALAEAMVTRDWKMLEMVADGLKAAGLRDLALEVVVLRGERDAALGARCTAGQVITWGLCCRAKAGDPKALEALRALAKADLAPATMPDAGLWRKDAAAANAAMKAYQASFTALEKRDEAVLCLALLKEPGVAPRALECMAVKRASQWGWGGGVAWGGGGARGDALLEAVLFADPQGGWNKLSELLNQEGEKASFDAQVRILQGVMGLLPKNRARWVAGGKEAFSVDALASELLPKDADEQLVKPYASLLKRCPPDAVNMSLNSVLYLAYSLPKQEAGSEILVALEGLKAKIAANEPNKAHLVQMIDGILAQHTGKAAPRPPFVPRQAVEPPKAPGEF